MSNEPSTGEIELEVIGNGISAILKRFYPFQPDGTPVTKETILELLSSNSIISGIDEKAIEYFVAVASARNEPLMDCLVAVSTPPRRKATPRLHFEIPTDLKPEDKAAWHAIYRGLHEFDPESDSILYPGKMVLIHENQRIGIYRQVPENEDGTNIFGGRIPSLRAHPDEFKAGTNVHFDDRTGTFTSGICGYLLLYENSLQVIDAFAVSKDRMKLFFLNLPRVNMDIPTQQEIERYHQKNNIMFDIGFKEEHLEMKPMQHPVVCEGKLPGESTDASIEEKFTIDKTIGTMDEQGKIDFKERNLYTSVDSDELLAIKKLPIRGKPGLDIFGKEVLAKMPKDVVLRNGPGTKVEKSVEEMRIYSFEEGIVEYNHGIISVFPKIIIMGDVCYETGNIESRANVEISGNVLAGFNVKSDKNVFIKGNVEDHCVIETGGDLTVIGGITGESTKIICQGAMTAKYIESCSVVCQNQITVQRFIRGAKIDCRHNIVVFGHSVNLNERGAIVDADIKVTKKLLVPVIGSDAGLKTVINLAHDEQLQRKIDQQVEACGKLESVMQELNDQFTFDITSPTIYDEMQSMTNDLKEKVIKALREKNQLEKKLEMMQKILEKEMKNKEEMIKGSSVDISIKVIPDLIIRAEGMQRTIDKYMGPSKFYLDLETHLIEKSVVVEKPGV